MQEGIRWTPYLEKMQEHIDKLRLCDLKEWNGHDLAPVRTFKTARIEGGFKAFSTEKVDKIGIGICKLNQELYCGLCTIFPDNDYDLPIFISSWVEREKEISLLIDFMPTVDTLVDEEYRRKYLESVQPLWEKYAKLPGICPEENDDIRSLCSIIYTAAKLPVTNEGMRLAALAAHTEYLKCYLEFLRGATPITSVAKKREVTRKKEAVRKTLRLKYFQEFLKGYPGNAMRDDFSGLIVEVLF